MKKKRQIAIILAMVLTVTSGMGIGMSSRADNCGGLEEVDIYQPAKEKGDVVEDPVLHWAIRSAMNAATNHEIVLTREVLENSGIQYVSFEQNNHPEEFVNWNKQYWIENLEGIQYVKTAKMIHICYSAMVGHQIKDVSPLAALTQLQTLMLKQDNISDISSLGTLVNLETFDVAGNQIDDVSVIQGMTKLKNLNVSSNELQNVEVLKDLEGLESIDISDNQIKALPDMSRLTRVTSFCAADNQLTDVEPLKDLTRLVKLDLSGNSGIQNVKALAGLIHLEKENTFLPETVNKDDLFAAIEVNKLLSRFNISHIKNSDLENVSAALEAYDALTEEQKTYMDTGRVEAARNNKEKVENGEEPDYYPEYDYDGGEKLPVWDRLEITVTDKYGNPIPNVEFAKTRKTSYTSDESIVKTDENGKLVLIHSSTDGWYDEIRISPAGEVYIASPEVITYAVLNKTTDYVNGKKATGLEELQFVLIPKTEYVDKTVLEKALENAGTVGEDYKYTQESYQKFVTALIEAQNIYNDVNASEEEVAKAADILKTAIRELVQKDILTQLKIRVKDKNGNPFTRSFKFQIRKSVEDATGAFNTYTDAYTSVASLAASPGWADGQSWMILACEEEPYSISPITVTIGVKNGQSYFNTVNGVTVDTNFEQEIIVTPNPEGAVNKEKERKPDSTVLAEYVNAAKQYMQLYYTPLTWQNLQNAIQEAESALQKSGVSQEDYNAAAALLKQAEKDLVEMADKTALKEEINLEFSVSSAGSTKEAWERYQTSLASAKEIDLDPNVSQIQVDEAVKNLKEARLALKETEKEDPPEEVNKSVLKTKISEMKAIEKGNYTSESYNALQVAVEKAEIVLKAQDTTNTDVENAIKDLENAKKSLQEIKLPFDDVPDNGEWYSDAVKYVYDNKIMTGLGDAAFGPFDYLARAQFAVILHRMNDTPPMQYEDKFPDVGEGLWYTDAILWANSIGVVTGYTDTGCFGTADRINREQMATMMYRYAEYKGYDTGMKADFSKFIDADRVNDFADEAMQWAVGTGIITGKYNGTMLDPQGNASRVECAVIMTRFMEMY